jgi:hypothetical protein
VSGAILRSMGRPGFVHIEMSWDVRQMLDESPLRLNAFFACLTRELR